jgi:hypothetical protein
MNFHGVSFNEDWVKSLPQDQFVNNSLNDGLWSQPGFEVTEKARKERLRELWLVLNPTHGRIAKKEVKNADNKQHAPVSGEGRPAFPVGE